MSSDIEYSIRPFELLGRAGWPFRKSGQWLSVVICPVCMGGERKDKYTFGVHEEQGNFTCLRTTCGASGNFWKLFEIAGLDPRDHIDGRMPRRKKKGFIYGK